MTQVTSKKIEEVNLEVIENLILDINNQINKLNIEGLSNDARGILNALMEKISTFKMSIGA